MLYFRTLLVEMPLNKFLANELRLSLLLEAIQGSRIYLKNF